MMSATKKIEISRLVAWLTLGIAAIWIMLAFVSWHEPQNGVRAVSPFSTYGYGQDLLFANGLKLLVVLGTLAWCLAAMIIGYAFVIRPLWGGRAGRDIWVDVLSGIVPGYFMIVAASRIVLLLLPPDFGVPVLVLATLIVAGFCALLSLPRLRGNGPAASWIFPLALAWGAIAAALVFQVQIDRGHAVAEGSIWFIQNLFLSPDVGLGTGSKFPMVSQHYDEAAFLFPLIHVLVAPGSTAGSELTQIYWVMLAVTRVSMIALVYVALRGLNVDRQSAAILVFFACAASLALNPFTSRLLFDSLSPLAYGLHMTRILAPVLPLLIVSAALQVTGQAGPRAWILATLLGLGLSAGPIHMIVLVPWALVVLLAFALSARTGASTDLRLAAAISGSIVLLAFSLAYGWQEGPDALRAGALAASVLLGAAMVLWALMRRGVAWPEPGSAVLSGLIAAVAVTVGYGLGLIFLGNVGLPVTLKVLGGVWPWNDLETLRRLSISILAPDSTLNFSPLCAQGYEWGYRTLTGHCGSLPIFVRTYGLPFVAIVALCGWRLGSAGLAPVNTVDGKVELMALLACSACLLAMPVAFVLFDFISPTTQTETTGWSLWLRSRFVEPWFLGGTLIAGALYFRRTDEKSRRWGQLVLLAATLVHILNPLVLPAQWTANAAFMTQLLAPGN